MDEAGRGLRFDRPHSLGSGYENDNVLKGGRVWRSDGATESPCEIKRGDVSGARQWFHWVSPSVKETL